MIFRRRPAQPWAYIRYFSWNTYSKERVVIKGFPDAVFMKEHRFWLTDWLENIQTGQRSVHGLGRHGSYDFSSTVAEFKVWRLIRGTSMELLRLKDGQKIESVEIWDTSTSLVEESAFDLIRERSKSYNTSNGFMASKLTCERRCHLHSLPNELILEIAKWLRPKDQHAFRNVSHHFRDAVPYPVIIKVHQISELSLTANGPPVWWIDSIQPWRPTRTKWQRRKAELIRKIRIDVWPQFCLRSSKDHGRV